MYSLVVSICKLHVQRVLAEECLVAEWYLNVCRVRDGLSDGDQTELRTRRALRV